MNLEIIKFQQQVTILRLNKDKKDIWMLLNKIIQIGIPVAIKSIQIIMFPLIMKILRDIIYKDKYRDKKKEKEAILFMTLEKQLIKNKNKISFNINLILITLYKMLLLPRQFQ